MSFWSTFLLVILIHSTAGQVIARIKRDASKCTGIVQNIELTPGGGDVIIETPGFNGDFIPGCSEDYEIDMIRDDSDMSQWRIRVDVLDMNIPCGSSELRILEDAGRDQNILYCDEEDPDYHNHIFLSHEHAIDITFMNQWVCNETGGCEGIGARFKVSAEYVCGGSFTEDHGSISSPFYPQSYTDSTTCIYDISAPLDKKVALTCPYFNLSMACNGRCTPYSGDMDFFQDVMTFDKYETTDLQGKTVVSQKFHATFYFLSNNHIIRDSEGMNGFNCTYTFVD